MIFSLYIYWSQNYVHRWSLTEAVTSLGGDIILYCSVSTISLALCVESFSSLGGRASLMPNVDGAVL